MTQRVKRQREGERETDWEGRRDKDQLTPWLTPSFPPSLSLSLSLTRQMNTGMDSSPIFANDMRDVLTANDNSIGNSGGTTEVKIRVHSRNNLYLFRSGFSIPINTWNRRQTNRQTTYHESRHMLLQQWQISRGKGWT